MHFISRKPLLIGGITNNTIVDKGYAAIFPDKYTKNQHIPSLCLPCREESIGIFPEDYPDSLLPAA